MSSIIVTFPNTISELDVQYNLMVGLKKNANRQCDVRVAGPANLTETNYEIFARTPEDFYLIGMTASEMIRQLAP